MDLSVNCKSIKSSCCDRSKIYVALETNQKFFNGWTVTQTVVHPHYHILYAYAQSDSATPWTAARQARMLEWVAVSFSRGSSWARDRTHVSRIGKQIIGHCAAWKAQVKSRWSPGSSQTPGKSNYEILVRNKKDPTSDTCSTCMRLHRIMMSEKKIGPQKFHTVWSHLYILAMTVL